jgi:hypothetical protein
MGQHQCLWWIWCRRSRRACNSAIVVDVESPLSIHLLLCCKVNGIGYELFDNATAVFSTATLDYLFTASQFDWCLLPLLLGTWKAFTCHFAWILCFRCGAAKEKCAKRSNSPHCTQFLPSVFDHFLLQHQIPPKANDSLLLLLQPWP